MKIDEVDLRIIRLFKCLSNGTRYRILKLLKERSYSVGELSSILNKESQNISQHLKVLKDLNLVSYATEWKNVIYSLKNKEVNEIIEIAYRILSRK
ncbi:MAG TPA: metalloregulator ArsR/SmtB family transcription factor [bacterium]|nr:metalloregulator ArsR/SmtB family transcription factor [bacterium]HOL47266.1 metalloregulator ArsR/SmtB family transcription factor [bacterium]HPQ19631.1 metalloregulator ArsR/SmtB family transcription factor [bacterium]